MQNIKEVDFSTFCMSKGNSLSKNRFPRIFAKLPIKKKCYSQVQRPKLKSLFSFPSFRSRLTERARQQIPEDLQPLYERVWDESDYVVPPSENNAFFVMTNVVITANQTRTTCPEDPTELPETICGVNNGSFGEVNITHGVCIKGHLGNLLKSHGETTGNCVESDRKPETHVCEIKGWCPVEIDRLPLSKSEGPLIPGAEKYTVFIKNSISFTRFGDHYHRTNMPQGICIYEPDQPGKKRLYAVLLSLEWGML